MTQTLPDFTVFTAVEVHTDGACVPNPGKGAWAAIFTHNDKEVHRTNGSDASSTNNRMEMTGAIEALRLLAASPAINITIFTDSQLLQRGATEWLSDWKRKGWKNSQKKPVANRDLWEQIDALVGARTGKVVWSWVKGHAGDRWNEEADTLAMSAI